MCVCVCVSFLGDPPQHKLWIFLLVTPEQRQTHTELHNHFFPTIDVDRRILTNCHFQICLSTSIARRAIFTLLSVLVVEKPFLRAPFPA